MIDLDILEGTLPAAAVVCFDTMAYLEVVDRLVKVRR